MVHPVNFLLTAAAVLAAAATARAQPSAGPPLRYELMINGESFIVEANRAVKLRSKGKPGVSYEVALRIAPTQRLKLNSVQFDYDWLTKVEDDRRAVQRSVRLTHELGFTMLISDLGRALETDSWNQALKILTESVTETFREMKVQKLQVGKPHQRKFKGSTGRGVVIRYLDADQVGHSCLIYVLVGEGFAASCIIQYRDNDADDTLPLVKKTLDSASALR